MERMSGEGESKMRREQLEALQQIQAVEFTAMDLNLYLDTHPADQRAMADFAAAICQLKSLHTAYISRYGTPGVVTDMVDLANKGCWNWVAEPWPWQIEY
jgi:spore coat protein JB